MFIGFLIAINTYLYPLLSILKELFDQVPIDASGKYTYFGDI
jgi:hypothetical protein